MKNILNIARHDLVKISGSVVAIITIMGLCIVPCLYAWFNIFSNWAPYESEATGRISVAVANEDEGIRASGLNINIGDKIIDALEGNDDIGWEFVSGEDEALEGVRSGRYYAALIIPDDFSAGVMSFMSGNLENPKLKYYENEKKNAIAPKITGKAKTAVQEQVNETFVETLASYVSDAASVADANGIDPGQALEDLSARADDLAADIDMCISLSGSAAGLTNAADKMMDVSDALIGSTQNALSASDKLLDDADSRVAKKQQKLAEKARRSASGSSKNAETVIRALQDLDIQMLILNRIAFDAFVVNDRDKNIKIAESMMKEASSQAVVMQDAGFSVLASDFDQLASKLGEIADDLSAMQTGMPIVERREVLTGLSEDISDAGQLVNEIKLQIRSGISSDLSKVFSETRNSLSQFRSSLSSANRGLDGVSRLMGKYSTSLAGLQANLNDTSADLEKIKRDTENASGILSDAAGSRVLARFSGLLADDEAAVASYLADPVKMDEKVIWNIENYGSALAPFYTVLAQWVGALLTAVLIKVKVKERKDLKDLRLHERFFGRYGLYMLIGISQALIVSLGDILYVRIQCLYPFRFILIACINGLVFTMINYALVFALDNIGLGAGVVVLVIQVAGSGGTYPVEVLPGIFKVLYPFMPFRYSMNAMRECIGGMYDGAYAGCCGVLALFFISAAALGLLLCRPAARLNRMMADSKAKSEIML